MKVSRGREESKGGKQKVKNPNRAGGVIGECVWWNRKMECFRASSSPHHSDHADSPFTHHKIYRWEFNRQLTKKKEYKQEMQDNQPSGNIRRITCRLCRAPLILFIYQLQLTHPSTIMICLAPLQIRWQYYSAISVYQSMLPLYSSSLCLKGFWLVDDLISLSAYYKSSSSC